MTHKFSCFLLLLALSILVNGQLFAHQKKEAITRVIFNERTQSIEIIHRFSIHDAEHSVRELFDTNSDILGDSFAQNHFAEYVAKNFTLSTLDGEAIVLNKIGHEIDGRYIWIYQETPLRKPIIGFKVTHNALREVMPEQVNLVNFEFKIDKEKKIRSLIFKGSTKEQTIKF